MTGMSVKPKENKNIISKIKRRVALFLVNKIFAGTNPLFWRIKRSLLNSAGHSIGEETKIVGPIECYGKLTIGKKCWIGKNLVVNGNGSVVIGDNCDIGPEVIFQTGGHQIGGPERRAGAGLTFSQRVGDGVWIGGRSTLFGNTVIDDGSVIAGSACVVRDVSKNTLVGGVPAQFIRRLD